MRITIGRQRTPEVKQRIISCGWGITHGFVDGDEPSKRVVGITALNRKGKYVRVEFDPDEIDVLVAARDKLRAHEAEAAARENE